MIIKKIEKRDDEIIKACIIGISINIILFLILIYFGLKADVFDIVIDGIKCLIAATTYISTIIVLKYSKSLSNVRFPHGYGKIEYFSTMFIGFIICMAGIYLFFLSLKRFYMNVEPHINILTTIAVLVSGIIKFILGDHFKKVGNKYFSMSLYATGVNEEHDSLIAISIVISLILYILYNVNIEALLGLFLSYLIMQSGYDFIHSYFEREKYEKVLSNIMNKLRVYIMNLDKKNIKSIYKIDMHNYTKDIYKGSLNIETLPIDDNKKNNLEEKIKKDALKKFGVIINAIEFSDVVYKDKKQKKDLDKIRDIVKTFKNVLYSYDYHIDYKKKTISFFVLLDYNIIHRRKELENIAKKINEKYKNYKIIMKKDKEFLNESDNFITK